jgi:hypothetical protein
MRPANRCAVLVGAFLLLISVVPCTAALVESRQTQSFLLDTVRYTEYAASTAACIGTTSMAAAPRT